MAIKQLRRLGAVVGQSLQDRILASTINQTYFTTDVDALEREHPELILDDGANIVAAVPEGGPRIIYGFESDRAFIDRFPAMFEKLLPKVRKTYRADRVRIRWSYAPARPMVEPVLRRLEFKPVRDWLEFRLDRKTKLPSAPVPSGVRFREGGIDDLDDIVRIDRECFPDTPIPRDVMGQRLASGEEHVFIAMRGKRVVAFAIDTQRDPDLGWLNILAVEAEERSGGIGAALAVRTAKRLFAAGAQEVGLSTDEGNPAARLYVRLGFRQTSGGRDYERLTDPKAIAAERRKNEGTLIRFGGWR